MTGQKTAHVTGFWVEWYETRRKLQIAGWERPFCASRGPPYTSQYDRQQQGGLRVEFGSGYWRSVPSQVSGHRSIQQPTIREAENRNGVASKCNGRRPQHIGQVLPWMRTRSHRVEPDGTGSGRESIRYNSDQCISMSWAASRHPLQPCCNLQKLR